MTDPDPKGGIGIQLSQYSEQLLSYYYFIIFRQPTKKGVSEFLKALNAISMGAA